MEDFEKDFEIELKSLNNGASFTKIPIEKSERQLCIRHDGVVYDGYLHMWEEIEYIKVFRTQEERSMKMKDRAKIIVDKFADLMLPQKEKLNELENMIREVIKKERIEAMLER